MATISIKIPDLKVAAFLAGFLREHPIPKDDNKDDLYTATEWIKLWIRRQLYKEYKYGAQKNKADMAVIETMEKILI